MGSVQLDFGLPLRQSLVPKSIVDFLNDMRNLNSVPEKLSKLEAYLQIHKLELFRIEPFQKDFPLCVQLLVDSIELLKEEILKLRESMPTIDLMNTWAFQAQDCAQQQRGEPRKHLPYSYYDEIREKGIEDGYSITLNTKYPSVELIDGGGPKLRVGDHRKHHPQQKSEPIVKNNRRSWSPQLHAKFVEALNALGGPKVARPKQIKEFMKIEGLTNDQIKSHLQKYRLQIRTLPSPNSNMVDVGFQSMQRQEMFASEFLSPSELQGRENAEVSIIADNAICKLEINLEATIPLKTF